MASAAIVLPPAPQPASKLDSPTIIELRRVTQDNAAATIQRLIDGYSDKSGANYSAAVANSRGCLLAQKGANRKV